MLEKHRAEIPDEERQKILQFKHMMVEAVRQTKKRRVEHGFNVCEEKGALVPSKLCVGEQCSVGIRKCPWPHTFLEMHTHPPGAGLMFSPEDLMQAISESVQYLCIGNVYKHGNIRCYKLNRDDPSVKNFIDAYQAVYWNKDESKRMELLEAAGGYLFGQNNMLELVEEWKRVLKPSSV